MVYHVRCLGSATANFPLYSGQPPRSDDCPRKLSRDNKGLIMICILRSNRLGTLVAVASLAVAGYSTASAEVVATVNGIDIDSTVFDTYIESRFQKPAAQATAEERALVQQEVMDIYLLTSQASAKKFAEDPRIKAQIELQYRGTIAQAVAADFMGSNAATDEEIYKEYELQLAQAPSLQFKARHILVETQSQAADLITQLTDGADFQELAKEHSTGPSGPNGGDLGWFSSDQMVKSFADAVAALENGAHTTEPVQSQFGWHVILREDSRANEPPTLESVRDVIKQSVEQGKFQQYIQELRDADAAEG